MLQAKLFISAAALCTAGLLTSTVATAETAPLAADAPSATPEDTAETALPAANQAEDTAEVTAGEPLVCPPGQFPSAFADVYPWEWAYEAVNDLASPSMECFDLPEDQP